MTPTTFRGRLSATISGVSICVLALASLLIYAGIRWALVRNLDEALLTLARTEIASAFDEPGSLVHVHDQAPTTIHLESDLAYEKVSQIVRANGELAARTSNLVTGPALEVDPALVARARDGAVLFADALRGGQPYRVIGHPLYDAEGNAYAMVVAVSRRALDVTLTAVAGVLLAALGVAGALAAFASSHVARRLTRPLDRIADAARTVGETNLAARIPEVSRDRELRTLVGLLNDMLARIEAAFASQRRFVADASHELRSPLSNLRGTIEVALRHPRSAADYQETLEVALAEIERLGRLVHGLLTLSRAGGGHLALARRPTDLADVAARAVAVHTARAAMRDVRLRLDAATPVAVDGDADRLREVIDNLLDNALRVAPSGSSVRVLVSHDHGRGVLEVEDAGPGLTEEDRAHAFEPFARGSAARGDGAGLGLAIARAVAEAHGGTLGVRTAPGAGATFRLELPTTGDSPPS
jgi:two-component system, OmpR family, sensor kinase